jgi:hypothetical protein
VALSDPTCYTCCQCIGTCCRAITPFTPARLQFLAFARKLMAPRVEVVSVQNGHFDVAAQYLMLQPGIGPKCAALRGQQLTWTNIRQKQHILGLSTCHDFVGWRWLQAVSILLPPKNLPYQHAVHYLSDVYPPLATSLWRIFSPKVVGMLCPAHPQADPLTTHLQGAAPEPPLLCRAVAEDEALVLPRCLVVHHLAAAVGCHGSLWVSQGWDCAADAGACALR